MDRLQHRRPARLMGRMARLYFEKKVSRSAAELAYFLILSFFPVLICVHSFIGALDLDPGVVVSVAETVVPRLSMRVLGEYIEYINENQSQSMLWGGMVMTVFSAASAFRGLTNVMYDLYDRRPPGGVRQFVASLLFSALFLVTVYLSLLVVITGNWLLRLAGETAALGRLVGLWQWLRFPLLFFLGLLFVLLLYRAASPGGVPRPPILLGGVLAAVALVLASMVFSMAMDLSTRYATVYGSLASVMVLLVWLYLCGNLLILGGVCNAARCRERARH